MNSESLTRPIFEELSDKCERADEWSEPKGFLIGGMGIPIGRDLGRQYFDAANVLIGAITRNEWADFQLAHPVLFLYRHSVELNLKGLLVWMGSENPWGHDLLSLSDMFCAAVEQKFNERVPEWIPNRIKELAGMDPKSTAFRYGNALPWNEVYVDVHHLKRAMNTLHAAFDSVWVNLDTPLR
jgi:hypothetical protein